MGAEGSRPAPVLKILGAPAARELGSTVPPRAALAGRGSPQCRSWLPAVATLNTGGDAGRRSSGFPIDGPVQSSAERGAGCRSTGDPSVLPVGRARPDQVSVIRKAAERHPHSRQGERKSEKVPKPHNIVGRGQVKSSVHVPQAEKSELV